MESETRARTRSGAAAVKRVTRAASEIVSAMTADALDGESNSRGIADGQYIEAESNLECALDLIRDCRRSIAANGDSPG